MEVRAYYIGLTQKVAFTDKATLPQVILTITTNVRNELVYQKLLKVGSKK